MFTNPILAASRMFDSGSLEYVPRTEYISSPSGIRFPAPRKIADPAASANTDRRLIMRPPYQDLLFLFPLRDPVSFHYLSPASQRQGLIGHRIGDDAPGADVAFRANLDRRDQRRIASDERSRADASLVFLLAIEIARDGARADVHPLADLGVAQVGKMLALGARAQPALLHLDEITHARVGTDIGVHAQPRKRPDLRLRRDLRIADDAVGLDDHLVRQRR